MEVLLAGNTGYVTETFIEESFPECDVVVLGNEMLKSNRKKNILSRPFIKDEKELKEIFETYEFERIVYFSNYLTMHGRMTGELEQLRQILQLCKKNKEIRMLYLTGQESIYNITSGKTLLVSAAENVVMEYGNMYQINTKILRIPHLYSAVYTQDFFYKLFTEAEESGKIVFEESPEQNIYFVCMYDLAELLYKVYDNWGKERCLNVPDCFRQSFSDLEKEIRKTIPGKLDIRYQNSPLLPQKSQNRTSGRYLVIAEFHLRFSSLLCHTVTSFSVLHFHNMILPVFYILFDIFIHFPTKIYKNTWQTTFIICQVSLFHICYYQSFYS